VPLEIVPQKDGSIIFETEVAGTEEIKFWVMSWGSNALVLESGSLREEIRAESEALLGKYGHTDTNNSVTLSGSGLEIPWGSYAEPYNPWLGDEEGLIICARTSRNRKKEI
jgi:hypothetical protein